MGAQVREIQLEYQMRQRATRTHYSKYEFEEKGLEGTPSNQRFTTGRHYQKLKPTSLKPLSYILRPGKGAQSYFIYKAQQPQKS